MRRLPCAVALLAIAVVIAIRPGDASGCGGAYRPGERVGVADETALIVWDAKSQTQHFIRRATFPPSGRAVVLEQKHVGQRTIFTVHKTPWWMGVLCCGIPVAFLVLSVVGVRWLVRARR